MSIVWLASYPKSGNTWLRTWLTNYLLKEDQPVSINQLIGDSEAVDRELFNELIGIDSTELKTYEIMNLRPQFHKHLAEERRAPYFIKVHDTYSYKSLPLFPESVTLGVIYIVRNPLDVAVSYAHHDNLDLSKIIELMCDSENILYNWPHKTYTQLPQLISSWSRHVESWVYESTLPTLVIKYEDMHLKPLETFSKIIQFLGLDMIHTKMELAVDFSKFTSLQQQEERQGFNMKQPSAKSFFRHGKIGSWKEALSKEQVRKINDDQGFVMKKFNYQICG